MESLRQRRLAILGAMSGDNTDWRALFTGLIDKTIGGDVVIPNTVETTKIVDYEFEGGSNLESIVLPPQITSLGNFCFHKCSNLVRVTKSDNSGLTAIGTRCFGDCFKLVEIPPLAEGITIIPNWAFLGTSLTSVDLPSSIVKISLQAFFSCSHLSYIIVRATTPPSVESNSLPNTIGSIYVPDASVSAYQAANNWSRFADKIKPLSELTA